MRGATGVCRLPRNIDSARLVWVDAFVAAAAYENYEMAGKMTGRASTTIKRQLEQLEAWLHRVLVTDDVPLIVTPGGQDFVRTSFQILELIEQADLRTGINKTRVQADGTVTIDGVKIETPAVREIGKLMVESRAIVDPNYKPPAPTSGKDIDMGWV